MELYSMATGADGSGPLDDARQERFARTYAMHPEHRGNATRSYLYAYRSEEASNTDSNDRMYRNASVQGSRLLKDVGVRARVRALQEDAVEEGRWCMARS